jgi:hypothetical protein
MHVSQNAVKHEYLHGKTRNTAYSQDRNNQKEVCNKSSLRN